MNIKRKRQEDKEMDEKIRNAIGLKKFSIIGPVLNEIGRASCRERV